MLLFIFNSYKEVEYMAGEISLFKGSAKIKTKKIKKLKQMTLIYKEKVV